MSDDIGVVSVAKRAATAVAKGELNQDACARLQTRLAQEQFPNDSVGVALSKFYATPHGAELLNAGLKANYETVQKRSALANKAEVLIAKAYGNPASQQTPLATPDVVHAEDNDDYAVNGDVDAKVKEIMQRDGVSFDVAISRVHRAEKLRKR